METLMTTVTVYIPTRNRSHLVTRAVSSVLCQTFADWECIVVDDGSDDDTPAIMAALVAADSRIRYLRSPASKGAPAARNWAISEARGRFVTGLDDDDMFLRRRLENLVGGLAGKEGLISSEDVLWKHGRMKPLHRPSLVTLPMLLKRNYVGNQLMAPKAWVDSVGGFDVGLRARQDYDLWLRLVEKYGPVTILSSAGQIIFESDSKDRISDDSSRRRDGIDRFLEKHAGKMSGRELAIHHSHRRRIDGDVGAVVAALRGFDFTTDGLRDVYNAARLVKPGKGR
jgi:glycosyltransferase involved in cell wall biosynthesis